MASKWERDLSYPYMWKRKYGDIIQLVYYNGKNGWYYIDSRHTKNRYKSDTEYPFYIGEYIGVTSTADKAFKELGVKVPSEIQQMDLPEHHNKKIINDMNYTSNNKDGKYRPYTVINEDGTLRIYHGTGYDYDFKNYKYDYISFSPKLLTARVYASIGSESYDYNDIVPLHKKRIITADIPLDIYDTYENDVVGYEIALPINIAEKHIVDDGRNSPLYGSDKCYDNVTLLPLNTPECQDKSNRIFYNPDNSPGTVDYDASFWLSQPYAIVHSFDSYYYDDTNEVLYYKFDDGSVLETPADDPTKYGFLVINEPFKATTHISSPINENEWIPYNDIQKTISVSPNQHEYLNRIEKEKKKYPLPPKKMLNVIKRKYNSKSKKLKPNMPDISLPSDKKTINKLKIPSPKMPGGKKPHVAKRQ